LRPHWVNDLDPLTNVGSFNDTTEAYIFGPGSIFELRGQDLNLGEYRDSTLNNTNQFELFFEQTMAWCNYGGGVWHVDNLLACPTGGTGDRETISCTDASVSSD
jgi:hypothetical protein